MTDTQMVNLPRDELEALIERTITRVTKRQRNDQGNGSAALGYVMKEHRTLWGYSQEKLAKAAGIHHSHISRIELGQRGMGIVTLARLTQVLGIDFADHVLQVIANQDKEVNG